jgi:hypothetical protein
MSVAICKCAVVEHDGRPTAYGESLGLPNTSKF